MAKYFAVTEKISNFAPALEKAREIFEKAADMAQLVEQRIRNAWVAGSSPAIGSLFPGSQNPQFLAPFSFRRI